MIHYARAQTRRTTIPFPIFHVKAFFVPCLLHTSKASSLGEGGGALRAPLGGKGPFGSQGALRPPGKGALGWTGALKGKTQTHAARKKIASLTQGGMVVVGV